MEIDYWVQRWQKQEIGFHLPDVHPKLARNLPRLNLTPQSRVLVPLCGKSRDLLCLSQSVREVVGIEISERAARSFFEENHLCFTREENGEVIQYTAGNIRIFVADFFTLPLSMIGTFEAIYDRAALIAMPESMQGSYVNRLMNFAHTETQLLLITLEYLQSEMNGPPFSVDGARVKVLFSHCDIQNIERHDILEYEPKFRAKGLNALHECVYLIKHDSDICDKHRLE